MGLVSSMYALLPNVLSLSLSMLTFINIPNVYFSSRQAVLSITVITKHGYKTSYTVSTVNQSLSHVVCVIKSSPFTLQP